MWGSWPNPAPAVQPTACAYRCRSCANNSTKTLTCRVVNRRYTKPHEIIGRFVDFLMCHHSKRIKNDQHLQGLKWRAFFTTASVPGAIPQQEGCSRRFSRINRIAALTVAEVC